MAAFGAAHRGPCPPRNVFIDMGMNWCNTVQLWTDIAKLPNAALPDSPWLVIGWEAAPLIMPYAERCMKALNAGKRLPAPPLPPTGSSSELFAYALERPELRGCYWNHTKDMDQVLIDRRND